MAQDYEIVQFNKGDFTDPHGNYWCDMALKGVSEPVRIVVKDPLQYKAGLHLYGKITDETSKAGKPYLRFRREQRPDGEQQASLPVASKQGKPDEQYWEDKNSAIKAQWAIGQAVQATKTEKPLPNLVEVESLAKDFYAMVDRVKGSSESTDPKVGSSSTTKVTQSSVEEQVAQAQAKRDADIVHAYDEGTPINLDEIPF